MNFTNLAIIAVLATLATNSSNQFKVDTHQMLQGFFIGGAAIVDAPYYAEEEPAGIIEWIHFFLFAMMTSIFLWGIIPICFQVTLSLANSIIRASQQCSEAALIWLAGKVEGLREIIKNGVDDRDGDFQLTPIMKKVIYVARLLSYYLDAALNSFLSDEDEAIEDIPPEQTKLEVGIAEVLREWAEEKDKKKNSGDKGQEHSAINKIVSNISGVSRTLMEEKTISNDQVGGVGYKHIVQKPGSSRVITDGGLPQDIKIGSSRDMEGGDLASKPEVKGESPSEEMKILEEITRASKVIPIKKKDMIVSPPKGLHEPSVTTGGKRTALLRYKSPYRSTGFSNTMILMDSRTRRGGGLKKKAKGQIPTVEKSRAIAEDRQLSLFVYSGPPQLIMSPTAANIHEETPRSVETVPAGNRLQQVELESEAPQLYTSAPFSPTPELPDQTEHDIDIDIDMDMDMDLVTALTLELEGELGNQLQTVVMEDMEVEIVCVDEEMGEDTAEENKDEGMSISDTDFDMDFLFSQADMALQVPSAPVAFLQTQEAIEEFFKASLAIDGTYTTYTETQSGTSEETTTTLGATGAHTVVSASFSGYISPKDALPASPQVVSGCIISSGSFESTSPFDETQTVLQQETSTLQLSMGQPTEIIPAEYGAYKPLDGAPCDPLQKTTIPGFSEPSVDTNVKPIFATRTDGTGTPNHKRKLETISNTGDEELQQRLVKPLRAIPKKTDWALLPRRMVRQETQKSTVISTNEGGEEVKRVKKASYAVEEAEVQPNYDVARINTQKMLNKTPSKGDQWLKERLDAQAIKRGEKIGSDGFFQLGAGRGPTRRR